LADYSVVLSGTSLQKRLHHTAEKMIRMVLANNVVEGAFLVSMRKALQMANHSHHHPGLTRLDGPGAKTVSETRKLCRDLVGSEVSVPHINNQMEFARIFLKVAQREYSGGSAQVGHEAEAVVKIALVEAKRTLNKLPIQEQSLFSARLDSLHLALDSLVRSTDHNPRGTRPV
jgi:hypothetical protein